jgi:hypothetical protein
MQVILFGANPALQVQIHTIFLKKKEGKKEIQMKGTKSQ